MQSHLAFPHTAITAFTAFPRTKVVVARQVGHQLPWILKCVKQISLSDICHCRNGAPPLSASSGALGHRGLRKLGHLWGLRGQQ